MARPTQRSDGSSRLAALDAGRVVAAAGIVFTHWINDSEAVWIRPVALIGVPYVIAAAVLLTVRQAFAGREAGAMLSARVRRIVVPFAVWTFLYFVLTYVISGWLLGGVRPGVPLIEVLNGCGGKLWFLPLIFLIGIAAIAAGKASAVSPGASAAVVALSLAGGGALVVMTSPGTNNIDRWPYELPVACAALAFAVAERRGWVRVPRSSAVGLGLLGVSAGLVAWQICCGEPPGRRACQAAGAIMVLAALAIPNGRVPGGLSRLGGLSYGVYISHMVVILALHRITGGRGSLSTPALLALYPLVVSAAFAFAWMLKRAPGFRRLMP